MSSYKTPLCTIKEINIETYLHCQISNTVGFPIKKECFDDHNVSICLQKKEKIKICYSNSESQSDGTPRLQNTQPRPQDFSTASF